MSCMADIIELVDSKPVFAVGASPKGLLYQGNCVELLNGMPEESVDMIFADPPYKLSNDGASVHAGKRVSVNKGDWDRSEGREADFEFHSEWITACKRVLKPSGTIWITGTYHSIYQCGYALQKLGFWLLNEIVWYKPNASPNLTGRVFAASHETIIWARRDQKDRHYFDYELMKQGEWSHDSFKNPGKQMRSVWEITPPPAGEKKLGKHPTQKPVKLLERIVLSSCPVDGLVVDPFSGSATTGVAAISNGRNYIGFELDSDFIKLSSERLLEASSTPRLGEGLLDDYWHSSQSSTSANQPDMFSEPDSQTDQAQP